jgi:3-phenylpropionate/trans-cinnamate dioxygenase ferredoxin reductase subunit
MLHFNYLIIGGGMAADAATQGIRELDRDGSITLIGAESNPPYNRPPLTKGLWKGKPFDSIWRHTDTRNVDLRLGLRAKALDMRRKQIVDEEDEVYGFDKLLLATGGEPRRLPFDDDEQIIYYRTLADYQNLRALAEKDRRFVVIGGGFIGSEIAAALTMNGNEVILLFPGKGIGSRMFPRELSDFLNGFYREKGVQVLPNESVTDVKKRGKHFILTTAGNLELTGDGIVVGIGIRPEVELARQAGLRLDDGIVVNEFLATSNPDVYAAGDVAMFYSPALGERMRVEHEDNALVMGRQAGRNMVGAAEPYLHQPYFYSDLFELGYEAVGHLDARMETVADWEEPFHKGVVYYLQQGRVQGVLLWNVWGQVDAARELIASREILQPEDLKSRLPAVKTPVGADPK